MSLCSPFLSSAAFTSSTRIATGAVAAAARGGKVTRIRGGTEDDPISSPTTASAILPQAIILSTLGLFTFVLLIPPLVVHIKHGNLSTTVLIVSIALCSLQNTINPLLWPNDDVANWAYSGHILCDIEAKIQIGLTVSIPGAATCICRQLATVLAPTDRVGSNSVEMLTASNDDGTTTDDQRHDRFPKFKAIRAMVNKVPVEVGLTLLLPIFVMSTHILIQPTRYNILPVTGCQYSLSRTWPSIPLFLVWPLLVSAVGSVYSVLIVVRLVRHRREVAGLLGGARLSRARFARVFVLAVGFVVVYTPTAAGLYAASALEGTLGSVWRWDEVHPPYWSELVFKLDFGGGGKGEAGGGGGGGERTEGSAGRMKWDCWVQVVGGLVVFVVFGLGEDARGLYADWGGVMRWWWQRWWRRV